MMDTNKEKNFLSAVVYMHNASRTIKPFIKAIARTLYENFESFEIICVDDASVDSSVSVVKEIAKSFSGPAITLITMGFRQGLESSMNAGIDLAIGDFVLEFDSPCLDYDPSLVMDVYRRALGGYDIVSATNTRRQLSSRVFYSLFNRASGVQYKLDSETFRIISRRALNRIHSMSKFIPYRKALYSACGLRNDRIYYIANDCAPKKRDPTESRERRETAENTLVLFTDIAYRLTAFLTLVMMLATLSGGIYTVCVFLLGKPVAGYTTIMLVMTGSFFAVFAILAIIIKHLALLVDLTFLRLSYIVESVEKVSG